MLGRFTPIDEPFDERFVDDLNGLFANEWWSADRTREETLEIVRNSQVCVGHVDTSDGRLASFTRVLTDYRTFAVVLDVIVRADLRGHGLGAALMDMVLTHPDLQRLRGMGLQCEESLVGFYERWGFSDSPGRSRSMKRSFDAAVGETPAAVAEGRR